MAIPETKLYVRYRIRFFKTNQGATNQSKECCITHFHFAHSKRSVTISDMESTNMKLYVCVYVTQPRRKYPSLITVLIMLSNQPINLLRKPAPPILLVRKLYLLFDRLPTPPFLHRFTTTTRSISFSVSTTTAAWCFCFWYLFRKNAVRNLVAFDVHVF